MARGMGGLEELMVLDVELGVIIGSVTEEVVVADECPST